MAERQKINLLKLKKEQRKLHKCPYCNKIKVKRVAVGIWHCRKCNAKFAGKAYSIRKMIIAKDELLEPEKEKEVEVV